MFFFKRAMRCGRVQYPSKHPAKSTRWNSLNVRLYAQIKEAYEVREGSDSLAYL
jgi:hypothetical protein